jgi:hypothetical protein
MLIDKGIQNVAEGKPAKWKAASDKLAQESRVKMLSIVRPSGFYG